MREHEAATARAFDGQAAAFERAPIQTDPRMLERLARFAAYPPGARVLDAGCGPGLVSRALLDAPGGLSVLGCDLSAEMVARARGRCAGAGARAEFVHASVAEVAGDLARGRLAPVDGAISRLVLHHAPDPEAFLAEQVGALRPGAILVLADHLADPDPELAAWHRRLEVMRDGTHTRNLSGGAMIDLMAGAGLVGLTYEEHRVGTTFDEWFDRGTPTVAKDECRAWLLDPRGSRSRAWRGTLLEDGSIRLEGVIGFARGIVPDAS